MMRRQPSGFTLIELMVTLAVVAILVVLGIPNYQHWIANTHIRDAQESIQNGLREARLAAVQRNVAVRLQLTSAANADWQICVPQAATPLTCTGGVQLETFVSAAGSTNVLLGASPTVPITAYSTQLTGGVPSGVTFDALGQVEDYGNTAIVRIDAYTQQAGNRRMVVTISPAGSVRMCDPQLSLSTSPQGCS